MKKRKTYEISVIDKTYSKTISDETKFYTSDTALELGFELKETEYNFESAEIVLLNIDDRSLVTRPVAKSLDSFTYELGDDINAHYGEWRGQLRFEQAGEIYVSSPVKFRIENDLSNERPPQLSDVQSWVSLKRYADGLVDELKQAVLSVETFDTNEATRQENETTRQQSEQERQSAELTRVENEKQRILTHDSLQENIDMIGKVKLGNLVENGNFKRGLENWLNLEEQTALSVENEDLKVVYVTKVDNVFLSNRNKVEYKDNMYYSIVRFNPVNLKGSVRLRHNGDYRQSKNIGGQNEFQTVSSVFKGSGSGNQTEFRMFGLDTKAGDYFYIDYLMLFDLTYSFGAGNEPSKEAMDWVIKGNGYFEELTISRDDIQQYEINQLRKAVLALGGSI